MVFNQTYPSRTSKSPSTKQTLSRKKDKHAQIGFIAPGDKTTFGFSTLLPSFPTVFAIQ
jgi:hypothetical protein